MLRIRTKKQKQQREKASRQLGRQDAISNDPRVMRLTRSRVYCGGHNRVEHGHGLRRQQIFDRRCIFLLRLGFVSHLSLQVCARSRSLPCFHASSSTLFTKASCISFLACSAYWLAVLLFLLLAPTFSCATNDDEFIFPTPNQSKSLNSGRLRLDWVATNQRHDLPAYRDVGLRAVGCGLWAQWIMPGRWGLCTNLRLMLYERRCRILYWAKCHRWRQGKTSVSAALESVCIIIGASVGRWPVEPSLPPSTMSTRGVEDYSGYGSDRRRGAMEYMA
jgi:hypothetical protein